MKKTFFSLGVYIWLLCAYPLPSLAVLRAPENVLQPLPNFVRPDISNNINSNRAPLENTDESVPTNESEKSYVFRDSSSSLPWWRISVVLVLIILFVLLQRSKREV
jgi:hypothetical protein